MGMILTGLGGGGSPGGAEGYVQVNIGGAFGGSSDLTWDTPRLLSRRSFFGLTR